MKTMTYDDAKALLKKHGYKVGAFADAMGISYQYFHRRNKDGLDARTSLAVYGFLLQHDAFLQQCSRHRDNEALQALVRDLDARK